MLFSHTHGGKGSDALERRPQLAAAMAEARRKALLDRRGQVGPAL